MRSSVAGLCGMVLTLVAASAPGQAQPLTADRAVQIALRGSTEIINARAGVDDARSGVYGAYGGVLPSVSAGLSKTMAEADNERGSTLIAGNIFPVSQNSDFESTTPSLSASWSGLRLSSWMDLSAARKGLRASSRRLEATRSDVALSARRQFYEVVRAIKLAQVSYGALKLARDDERRVRALFEVGSVAKSDLLQAQVRTTQAELDSLARRRGVVTQRLTLADVIGVRESELGEIDTLLVGEVKTFEESQVLADATRQRPDLLAAEAEFSAARAAHGAARFSRLPYVTMSGSMTFGAKSEFTQDDLLNDVSTSGDSETDRETQARVALQWDFFDGLLADSRIASARAREARARATRDAAQRRLTAEVHDALLAYGEAIEGEVVARRALESATENLKLTQEKYNVGSATILDLINAQVQLQRAQSDLVAALTFIRVGEAVINRVRGLAE